MRKFSAATVTTVLFGTLAMVGIGITACSVSVTVTPTDGGTDAAATPDSSSSDSGSSPDGCGAVDGCGKDASTEDVEPDVGVAYTVDSFKRPATPRSAIAWSRAAVASVAAARPSTVTTAARTSAAASRTSPPSWRFPAFPRTTSVFAGWRQRVRAGARGALVPQRRHPRLRVQGCHRQLLQRPLRQGTGQWRLPRGHRVRAGQLLRGAASSPTIRARASAMRPVAARASPSRHGRHLRRHRQVQRRQLFDARWRRRGGHLLQHRESQVRAAPGGR